MAKGLYHQWLEPDGLLLLEAWARDGLTDEQIAHNIGINKKTLYDWKNRFSNFSNALKKSKEVVDIEVENALKERATGCVKEIKKVFKVKQEYFDEYGRKCYKEELQTRTEEIYVPADVTAQIYWLKNRKRDVWRDKPENTDNTALDKLDSILEEVRANAIKQETE